MQQQHTRLQAEKDAALARVKRLQSQQSARTSFLQRTAADVQNTASSAANQNSQLATYVDIQLDEIKALILGAQITAQETSNTSTVISTTYTTEDENGIQHTNDDSLASRQGLVSLSCAPSCHNPNALKYR